MYESRRCSVSACPAGIFSGVVDGCADAALLHVVLPSRTVSTGGRGGRIGRTLLFLFAGFRRGGKEADDDCASDDHRLFRVLHEPHRHFPQRRGGANALPEDVYIMKSVILQ